MLIITQPEFHTTLWQAALPNAEVVENTSLPASKEARIELFRSKELVLLLSQIPDWETLMCELRKSKTPWMILSRNTSMEEFRKIVAAGARGYLDALSHPESLKTAVQSVETEALWIPEPFMSHIVKSISQKLPQLKEPDLSQLSPKEVEVAKLMTQGTSNKEIAQMMNVTERTIKSHLTQIYTKLNIRDRMQLMLYMQGHEITAEHS